MVHCLSRRHKEIVAPTVHQGAAQPLVSQDGKRDKEGAQVEPVWDKNNTIHKVLHSLLAVMSSFISVSYSVGFKTGQDQSQTWPSP